MNTPSPLIPQGSLLEQQAKGRSRVHWAVFVVVAAHVVFLGPLLIQGCKPDTAANKSAEATNTLGSLTASNWEEVATASTGVVEVATSAAPALVTSAYPGTVPATAYVAPGSVMAETTGGTVYTVVKGDTMAEIAAKNHLSTKALLAANPTVNPTRMKIGEKITIPPAASNTGSSLSAAIGSTSEGTYKVKSGDTLSGIAKLHRTTAKELQSLNGLKTTQIRVGQVLKLPAVASAPPPAAEALPVPSTMSATSGAPVIGNP